MSHRVLVKNPTRWDIVDAVHVIVHERELGMPALLAGERRPAVHLPSVMLLGLLHQYLPLLLLQVQVQVLLLVRLSLFVLVLLQLWTKTRCWTISTMTMVKSRPT